MNIIISNSGNMPIYEQIVMQIKGMILAGKLKEGDPIPSMRLLAKELRISVITTKRAYEELEKAGFIDSVTGKGSFVAQQNVEMLREQNLQQIEEKLQEAVLVAQRSGVELPELLEIVQLIYKGE